MQVKPTPLQPSATVSACGSSLSMMSTRPCAGAQAPGSSAERQWRLRGHRVKIPKRLPFRQGPVANQAYALGDCGLALALRLRPTAAAWGVRW